ncbi:MAG: transcriptional repressor [Acidobacteria bacterium]|nr:transcriptional repressor [Acidobacteriota bacterium]
MGPTETGKTAYPAKQQTRTDRIHVECLGCGRVEEFASPLFAVVRDEIARTTGYSIQAVRLGATGHCRSCRIRQSANQH